MDILFLLGILGFVFIICVIIKGSKKYENMGMTHTGTYIVDTVNSGKCNSTIHTSECDVGSCPIGSNVTNREYCYIDCAQEVLDSDRKKCMIECLDMMSSCR
jgi:hypothetical protein